MFSASTLAAQGVQGAPHSSYTLDSILTSLHRAAEIAQLATAAPDVSRRLDSLSNELRARPGATALNTEQLASVVTNTRSGLATVARWNPDVAKYATQPAFRDALLRLARIGNSSIEPKLDGRLSPQEIRALLAPLTALHAATLRMSQAWNEEKLRRFELKYGPDAPTLNGVEVLLNYGAQWVPALGPRSDGAPNPLEVIAAYRTLELAVNEAADTARMVATAQFGLRRYFWNANWGTGNRLQRMLRPRHASAGIVLLGPSEKPFVRAWGADHRRGVFLGWGALHAAYVFESPRRILIGTGKQLIPYAF